MPPTPDQTRAGYFALWNRATVRPQEAPAARAVAHNIIAQKALYKKVEDATGVPWFMIGPIHNRESSLRFNAHLHCGTPLTRRTTLVPKGRPKASPKGGGTIYTWDESAIDALSVPPHDLAKVKQWSVERILYETEKYNGWGYLGKGNSPYLWAGTSEYHGGKYVADHVYDKNAWDKQLGCVAILKTLADMDVDVANRLKQRQQFPPKGIDPNDKAADESIRNATNLRNGAGGAGVAGGATKGTEVATKPADASSGVAMGILLPLGIAICFVVMVVAIVRIANKRKEAADNALTAWEGSK